MGERLHRPDGWLVLRGLLLLAFTLVGTAGAAHSQDEALRDMDAFGYLLAFGAAAPFLTAPMLPLPSLAVSAVAVSTYSGVGYAFGPVLIALGLVTVIAAESTPSSRTVAVFIPFAAVVTTGLTIRFGRDPDESALVGLLAGAAWLGVPWTIGTFIRYRTEGRVQTRREEAARATDAERLRIAAEVHDVAGHGLAVIAMQAGVALHVLERRPEQARIALEEIRAASTEALDGLRATLAQLRTPDAEAPLAPGLPGLADLPALVDRIRRAGLPVELELRHEPDLVPPQVEHAAYRVAQEALTNVLRHAEASSAKVYVDAGDAEVIVSVRDDGTRTPGPEGSGIAGMRARVADLGGVFLAAPAEGGGFEVSAVFVGNRLWPQASAGQGGA